MLDFNQYSRLTFDCYGTLIDWEQGILLGVGPVLERHDIRLNENEILELYGELESTAQSHEPFRPYKQVLIDVMDGFGERLGFTLTEDERQAIDVADWPAFPDSPEALRELAQHVQLVILSNVDDDLFAHSARRLQVDFAEVITSLQVGSYKPTLRNFHAMIERLDTPSENILHVAQSLFHDIAPANAVGLTTVWVNRRLGRAGSGATPPAEAVPDLEVPDLKTLARMVTDARGAG